MKIKNDALDELEKQYSSALQDYLVGRGETALERAYELGRRAIADRLGILDMAIVHQRALVRVLPCTLTPQESSETIKKAAQFFAESMAPFEMTFRGFQESITELHNLNKTLEQSEMKFRSVIQAANDAIISVDSDGNVISWNKRAETIFGYVEEEVLGKPLAILLSERHRGFLSKELKRFRSTGESKYNGKTLEFHGLRKDGSEFPIEVSVAIWKTEEGGFFTGIVRDITERKKADEKIREQAALLDKAHDAIAVRDLEHCLIYWNKGAQRLYGWTEEEAIGKNANELLYKEESSNLIEAKSRVIENGEWKGELQQRTKDGKEVIVESRWSLVRDSEDKPRSILIINTDITEKKKLEAQLLRAQRMESIGTLAGGIAHDLNNLMTPIMLSLQMLKHKLTDEQSQKLLTILENNSQRSADLIKQVLSFARGVEGERKPLQVTYIISEIEKVLKETFPRNIEIRTDLPKDLSTISGDATQLHQVMMNLCVNARDAMPDGGILRISARNFLVDGSYARMNTEANIGPYIIITVSDTGTGIPPEIIDRIFEPFFTTKEFGKGTGLGLSTSHAIVKSHGGFINVYSEVGKGTIFKIYLPAIKTEMQKAQEQKLDLSLGHGELVLIVEDEASIRDVTCSTLETCGYKVLTADDGAQAVALYAKDKDKINIVLMDMMMPVMDGHASIKAIHRINPGAKIIATSGLSEKDKLMKVTGTGINAFLPKPYTAEQLLKTINEAMFKK
ncbi:Methanogenesis regulatory histidine kinase FilI [uncultured archaeon]|nr:Methanogenesis regulatory histidine kinase FilI [uncultured archaeon]